MFSKAKNKTTAKEQLQARDGENATKVGANSTTASQKTSTKRASNMKSPGVPSIISTDVALEGNLTSSGEVQFDGTLTGNIRAASLIIGEKATVKGEVACDAVTIRGRVEGMVRARNVALASTAHIEGDIMHSSLSVEPGAHFDGNCRHSDDPLADDATKAFDRPAGGGRSAPRPAPSAQQSLDATAAAQPQEVAHIAAPAAVENGSAHQHQATTNISHTPTPNQSFQNSSGRDFNEAFAAPNAGGATSDGNGMDRKPGQTPPSGASSFMVKNRSPLR